jgi:hypothetical protein
MEGGGTGPLLDSPEAVMGRLDLSRRDLHGFAVLG